MTYHVEISSQADADLGSMYEYIAFELQSPDNTIGQLNRIEVSIMGVKKMPECFHKYENEPCRSRGLRIMTVNNYCVFYIPDTEKAVVTIIRVMYGGRDIDTQLKQYTRK